ncbi:hypothetical protein [Kocuria varians]|uniref:hypothetical protein n=1 Tax=Kocuria varians TaxID=1272 RepID=UPI001141F1CF|nr:hypothetical protein [Kocuria varians]
MLVTVELNPLPEVGDHDALHVPPVQLPLVLAVWLPIQKAPGPLLCCPCLFSSQKLEVMAVTVTPSGRLFTDA